MKSRLLLWCVGPLLLSLVVSLAHAEWKFSGYTQARFNAWDNDVDDDSFDLRRVRIKAEGPVFGEETTIKLQFDLSGLDDDNGEVELKDALITRKFTPDIKGAMGYTSVPFGYEVPTSSSKRLALERSEVARRFFPGERATGAWFMYHPAAVAGQIKPMIDLGYTNGLSKWYDEDSSGNEDAGSHAFFARVQAPFAKTGLAGLSYMAADRERTIGGVDTPFGSENIFGAHLRYDSPSGFAVQGEYYTGEILDKDVTGLYGLLEYKLPKTPKTLFYRYDTCDRSMAFDFTRHTAGIAWDVDKNERVTLQGEFIEDYVGNGITNYALQYQVKY